MDIGRLKLQAGLALICRSQLLERVRRIQHRFPNRHEQSYLETARSCKGARLGNVSENGLIWCMRTFDIGHGLD